MWAIALQVLQPTLRQVLLPSRRPVATKGAGVTTAPESSPIILRQEIKSGRIENL